MDCSLRGSSDHGIFQARVLEWGAIAFSDPSVVIANRLFKEQFLSYFTKKKKKKNQKQKRLRNLLIAELVSNRAEFWTQSATWSWSSSSIRGPSTMFSWTLDIFVLFKKFLFIFIIYLVSYFWLYWVFLAAHGFPLVEMYGFLIAAASLLWSPGSRVYGLQ